MHPTLQIHLGQPTPPWATCPWRSCSPAPPSLLCLLPPLLHLLMSLLLSLYLTTASLLLILLLATLALMTHQLPAQPRDH